MEKTGPWQNHAALHFKSLTAFLFSITPLMLLLQPCAIGAWRHNADFEGGTIGELAEGPHGFTKAFSNSKFTDTIVNTGTRSSTVGIKEGFTGFGGWGGELRFPSALYEGDELWYRSNIYFPADFDYSAGGVGLKMMRIKVATNTGSNVGYLGFVLSNKDNRLRPGSEVDKIDFNTSVGNKTVGQAVPKGVWQAYEMYVKFSATPGEALYRIWQNDTLVFEDTINNTLDSPTSKSPFVYMFSYWNDGAPKTQTAYVDDIVITNETPAGRDAADNPFIGVDGPVETIVPPKVKYSFPQSGDDEICVFDVSGQRIERSLVKAGKLQGRGVYFVTGREGNRLVTKKIVVVR